MMFPEQAGVYVAQRSADIILLKIKGVYPLLKIVKGVSLDDFITEKPIKEVDKNILANIELFPEKWNFSTLQIDTSVFPKQAFKPGSMEFSKDEYLDIRSKYYRLRQSGVSYNQIEKALVYEYKISMQDASDLIKKFDKDVD